MKFTILVDPSSVIIILYLVYQNHAPYKRIFLKEILVDPTVVIFTIYLVYLIHTWKKRGFLKK